MWWVKYIGIPFTPGGRSATACDCWGLVRLVYQHELGKRLPSWDAYTDLQDLGALRTLLGGALPQFDQLKDPEPFSIALFRSPSNVFHVGVLIDADKMLHITSGKDACIEPWRTHQHQLKGFFAPHDQSRCSL